MTIFHVEQEVEGSETMALQSVLECYAERELLLKKEKDLLKSGNDADLAQVGSSLELVVLSAVVFSLCNVVEPL